MFPNQIDKNKNTLENLLISFAYFQRQNILQFEM